MLRPNKPGGSPRARAALAAAAAAGMSVVAGTSVYLTRPWEGTVNHAYWDKLAKQYSICSGDSLNVHKGDYRTTAQCNATQIQRMERDYHKPLQACIGNFSNLPLGVQWAFLDLAWNLRGGAHAVCASTAARRVRAHNYPGACEAITWFDKAGKEVVPGLKARRTNGDKSRLGEYEVCMESLK